MAINFSVKVNRYDTTKFRPFRRRHHPIYSIYLDSVRWMAVSHFCCFPRNILISIHPSRLIAPREWMDPICSSPRPSWPGYIPQRCWIDLLSFERRSLSFLFISALIGLWSDSFEPDNTSCVYLEWKWFIIRRRFRCLFLLLLLWFPRTRTRRTIGFLSIVPAFSVGVPSWSPPSKSKILAKFNPTFGEHLERFASSACEGVARVSPVDVKTTPFMAEGTKSV